MLNNTNIHSVPVPAPANTDNEDFEDFDEEAQQSPEEAAVAAAEQNERSLPKTVSWFSFTSSSSKRCIPKRPRSVRVCARMGCCLFVLLALLNFLILFLIRYATSGGCGIELSNISPNEGGMSENGWTSVHWLGMRNFGRFIGWAPPFRNVKWAARPVDSTAAVLESTESSSNSSLSSSSTASSEVAASKRMAFTFDDAVGSNATAFNLVLDYLASENIKATFFIIADKHVQTDEGKAALKRAVAEGHQIGNHGVKNSQMASLSYDDFSAAVTEWETVVSDALERPWPNADEARWFRPPQGLMSSAMNDVLVQRGYAIVLGDLYSDDWAHEDRAFHAGIIKYGAVDGSIAILHVMDGDRSMRTLAIMRDVVPALRSRGFTFSRVDAMFKNQGPDSAPLCADAPLSTSLIVLCFLAFNFFFVVILGILLWDVSFCLIALVFKACGRPVPWAKTARSGSGVDPELPLQAPSARALQAKRPLFCFGGCCSFRRDEVGVPDSPTSTGNPDFDDDETFTVDAESAPDSPHRTSYYRKNGEPPKSLRVAPAA